MKKSHINAIQASILRQLEREDGLRFAQINVGNVPSDQFSYHLRQLVKTGLIQKTDDQTYSLTPDGHIRVLMLYPSEAEFIEQGFLAVRIVLSKEEDGKRFYLLQKRTLVPYKGTYGTPGNKILFGEDVHEAAKRIMLDQTGLTCELRLRGLRHLKDTYEGEVMQDKYFFVFSGSEPQGTLVRENSKGENVWLSYEDLEASGLSIQGGFEILKIAQSEQFVFEEQTYAVSDY